MLLRDLSLFLSFFASLLRLFYKIIPSPIHPRYRAREMIDVTSRVEYDASLLLIVFSLARKRVHRVLSRWESKDRRAIASDGIFSIL